MSNNKAQLEMQNVIKRIKEFWDNNLTDISIVKIIDKPFDMFTLSIKLYGRFDILVEYDRSTLGFRVKKNGQFVILSKLSKIPIFRGFDSYSSEKNILYNFKALDDVLCSK